MKENCSNCKFLLVPPEAPQMSLCRRFPPTMALDTDQKAWASHFTVIGDKNKVWCGEWKIKIELATTLPGH